MSDHESRPAPVRVLAGLPRSLTTPDGVDVVYPDTTIDMIKVMREVGLNVEFADPEAARTLVGHKAFDVWLPILEFSSTLLGGTASILLANLIQRYFDNRDAVPVAHISWRVGMSDGSYEEFDFDGPSDLAVEAATVFETNLRRRMGVDDGDG